MPQTLKDIDAPLGQAGRPPARGLGAIMPGAATLGGCALVAVLAVGSGLIALRERPFRDPARLAVSTPEVVSSPVSRAAAPQAAAEKVPAAGGPSIIRVDPKDAGDGGGVVVIRDPSAVGQDLRVAHLPDRALVEQTEMGPLPVRAADGRRPFDVYARPWSGARGARVAIVIGGLAVSQTGTQQAIGKLPAEVTLAFAPDGNSVGRWMQEARRKGHEIVMQVPLEPFDYPNVNPGRNTLTVAAAAEENLRNLHWTLSRTTNYVGVMNYMGARFSADSEAMQLLMAELGRRGLLYLDDGTSARSTAPELSLKNGVPFAAGDAGIDAVQDRGEILKKLDQLEATARARGFALGTGSAFDLTVDTVTAWIAEARRRGIEIVPVSALATDPERS